LLADDLKRTQVVLKDETETKAVTKQGSETLLCKRPLSHVEAAEKPSRKAFRRGKRVYIFVNESMLMATTKHILGAIRESINQLFCCILQMPAIIWIIFVKPKMFTLEWLWNWVSACSSSFTDPFDL
jgi:hypothetical protein